MFLCHTPISTVRLLSWLVVIWFLQTLWCGAWIQPIIQQSLLWCARCSQCTWYQFQLLLSLNPWWCCESNNLIHHPLSWIAWTLLSVWRHCCPVVVFYCSWQKFIQPFFIFDLLKNFSFDLPYHFHPAQYALKGPPLLPIFTFPLEIPSFCYMNHRLAIISINVTVIWGLDECLHGLG